MKRTIFDNYEIEIFIEHYRGSIIDCPRKYDKIFDFDEEYSSNAVGIAIYADETQVVSALVCAGGGGTGVNSRTVIFENDRVVFCCGDSIFCLSVPQLSLIWKTQCDTATCFGLLSLQTDYIVHGELEITRMSHDGNIIWQFSGSDIFTTPKGGGLEMKDGYVVATDWNHNAFKIDFNGNLLN